MGRVRCVLEREFVLVRKEIKNNGYNWVGSLAGPWKLARETVSLDILSNGRFILGAGLGWPPEIEFGPFSETVDNVKRGEMLDEGLDVLTGLWKGKRFSYNGNHFNINNVIFKPTPLQTPRIPIWIGGMWPNKKPFIRASKWDGVFPISKSEKPCLLYTSPSPRDRG